MPKRNVFNPEGNEWTDSTIIGQLRRLEAFWPTDLTLKVDPATGRLKVVSKVVTEEFPNTEIYRIPMEKW